MHIESSNRAAFNLVTDALADIDVYKGSKELHPLQLAKEKLDNAMRADPDYLRALYYRAMVSDLIGEHEKAAELFERVLAEHPPFIDEVRYNLGIAYYHRYNKTSLDRAAQQLRAVLQKASSKSSLHLLARAGLGQVYAMRMIPTNPAAPTTEELEEVSHFFELVEDQHKAIGKALNKNPQFSAETLNEVKWARHNARGMAVMYHSDYTKEDAGKKTKRVQTALSELYLAQDYTKKNWANYCDLGSAHMRLGYYLKSQEEFTKAYNFLTEVIDRLKPNYGFAIYELGRAHRLNGDFQTAIELQTRALQVPYPERAVSDRKVGRELERAQQRDQRFP